MDRQTSRLTEKQIDKQRNIHIDNRFARGKADRQTNRQESRQKYYTCTDFWMDRQTDRIKDYWMDGQTDIQTSKQTDKNITRVQIFGWTDKQTESQTIGWMDRQTYRQVSRQTDTLHMYRLLDKQINRQNYRLLDGWTDSQTIGWMDRRINSLIE